MASRIKIKRRGITLRFTLIFAAFCIAVLTFLSLSNRFPAPISGQVNVFIGTYPDILLGKRASFLRLADELVRHPEANKFVVRRNDSWLVWDEWDRSETLYDRHKHTVNDGNSGAGDTEEWGKVTDEAIKKAAKTSGDFKSLGQYGCENMRR